MRSVFRFLLLSFLLTLFVFTCACAAVNQDDDTSLPDIQTILAEAEQTEQRKFRIF